MRPDKRKNDELRKIEIRPSYLDFAEGSAFIEVGKTKVICAASVLDDVPPFLKGKGQGWITSEYGMLPRSTQERTIREASRGKISGRTYEIQRLIGRSLRAVVDLNALGEKTIWIDADVIQADGGTRVASINGAFIALALALQSLEKQGVLNRWPVLDWVAAISVGVVDGEKRLDLSYQEDSMAEVDMNIVMTGKGKIIEVQGTAERSPFSVSELNELIILGKKGIMQIIKMEKDILGDILKR